MAIIPINDTHRLPYIKGEFTAVKLGAGATTPVKFYDADDNELGYKIYTNSEGFVCDANGNLLGNGVFVHVDSVINAHYNGNRFSQWVAKGYSSGSTVNDGKMLNAEGQEIWSANSPRNYTLQWTDIAGKPQLNEWSENEQVVLIDVNSPGGPFDAVIVNKFTKIMTLSYSDSLPEAEIANIILSPQPSDSQRYGQVIFVQRTNARAKKVCLWNASGSQPFCTIPEGGNAVIALLSDGSFVALSVGQGNGESTGLGIGMVYQTTFIAEDTPGTIAIRDNADGGQTMYMRWCMNAVNLGNKSKRLVLIWQPDPQYGNQTKKLKVYGNVNQMTLNGVAIMELMPYRACEVIVTYDAQNSTAAVVPIGNVDTTSVPAVQSSPTTLNDSQVTRALFQSASTVLDLALSGGTTPTPEDKKVFPIRVEVPPNFEGDITVMNTSPLTHLTNFEIHVGFQSGGQNLKPNLVVSDQQQILNNMMLSVYRSNAADGANKGKFFAIFHVISFASGGLFVCYNPETEST